MEIRKAPPEILLYSPNKRDCLGIVKSTIDFTEDIRFNSCSEISFTVPKYIYNINSENWEQNSIYGNLKKNNLIHLTDNTEYFQYPAYIMGGTRDYTHKDVSEIPDNTGEMEFIQNNALEGFRVQAETQLFDIGSRDGYTFEACKKINTSGAIEDHGAKIGTMYGDSAIYMSACDAFIPVSAEDVIAINNDYKYHSQQTYGDAHTTSGYDQTFLWRVAAYTDKDPSTYVGMWTHDTNYVYRINVAEKLPSGGYVRFWYQNTDGTAAYSHNSTTEKTYWINTIPVYGYAKVYSGERKCSFVRGLGTSGSFSPKLRWFLIQDVKETGDGLNCTKTITALSYEYSLHNTTFSLSSATLPLYIPEAIPNLVKNTTSRNGWIRNKIGDTVLRSPQRMQRGLLNQILDELPNWKIGHVTPGLMTRYRQLDDVDEANIYSYLMDTVQKKYNCFIVFDCDEQTISAYSQDDAVGRNTPIYLSWDNSIKTLDKTNQDSAYYTALRVHAGDSQYGIGLVNPTGNSLIYNFNHIKSELNYTVTDGEYSRTLSDAVSSWEDAYNNSKGTYLANAINFIQTNQELIALESKLSQVLADYRAKADTINIYLRDSFQPLTLHEKMISDVPRSPATIKSGDVADYHSEELRMELYSLAVSYQDTRNRCNTLSASLATYRENLKNIAKKLTMDYSTAYRLNNSNAYAYGASTTILSAAEIKALKLHIIEGNWTDEYITFDETYSANDISSTLTDCYNEAVEDLDQRLAKPNFDFSISSANITALPDFEYQVKGLLVGGICSLDVDEDELLHPLLLAAHIDYKKEDNFEFTFTTDMKRRPMDFRFADLYSTITQTSVTDSTFTFDE